MLEEKLKKKKNNLDFIKKKEHNDDIGLSPYQEIKKKKLKYHQTKVAIPLKFHQEIFK